ncbi:MAG TPA: carboxypeptidase regulatory-like domain-containing protein [bacterium]|nr:carboxypeptidase regulatory-like domain-containing protein [bacterium]
MPRSPRTLAGCLFALLFLLAPSLQAAPKGGTLTGTLTVTAPPRKAPPSSTNYAGYGNENPEPARETHTLPEEVVFFLKKVPGHYKAPKKHVQLDQHFLQFTTRVLPILKGTTVDFTNNDRVYHNVFTNSQDNKFDLGRRKNGDKASVTFKRAEVPVKVFCEIHNAMKAYILVLDNPYFTKCGPNQHFRIKDIPPGTYTLVAWHDLWEPVEQKVTIKRGKTTDVDVTLDKTQE